MLALFQETINNRPCAYTASSNGHKINRAKYTSLSPSCMCLLRCDISRIEIFCGSQGEKKGGKRVSVYCPTTSEVENATIVEREKFQELLRKAMKAAIIHGHVSYGTHTTLNRQASNTCFILQH